MEAAKSRLAQTFKFLKELNDLRNPVPTQLSGYSHVLPIDEWPLHPVVQVRRGDRKDEEEPTGDGEPEPIIRIRRAELTPCPKPPEALDGWLKPGWQSIEAGAEVLPSRNFEDEHTGSITVAFEDDEARVTAFEDWEVLRNKWAAAEQPAVAARKLFEEIHALWTAVQRDGDRTELILAEGILDVPSDLIRHPVLVQRISLEFDPSGPEFRFDTGTERVELNRALLRLVKSIDSRMIAQFDAELEAAPVEPLGGDSTTGFLRRLVQGLFATNGEFIEKASAGNTSDRPTIRRMPVIFLRPRSAGHATALDHIIEDLQRDESTPPEGLARIVGVEPNPITGTSDGGAVERVSSAMTADADILFSKPANSEQFEIAARLAKAKAVLVQGPPGTGKTHTIANLLGYLLGQGKTVLVTAHTTKALRVLREKVDDALKSLCLSVLDSDGESQSQLKTAAQEIANRLSGSDAAALRHEAALLRERRTSLLTLQETLREQLRAARFSEVEELVIGGEGLSPIEAAKRVRLNAERDGWIPGPVKLGIISPLSDVEVGQLYSSNGILTPSDEIQLSVPQPELSRLVPAPDFRLLAAEKASADARAEAHRSEFWAKSPVREVKTTELQDLHLRVKRAVSILNEQDPWLREVLYAGWFGGELAETWRDLVEAVNTLASEAARAQRLIAAHGPQLPEGRSVDEVAEILRQILVHLENGRSLGLRTRVTKRGWHALLELCSIEVQAPDALEKIRALHALARLKVNRTHLARRWQRLVETHAGPAFSEFGASPERAAQAYAEEICGRLEWRNKVWEPLVRELHGVGFLWEEWLSAHPPVVGDHGELSRVAGAASQNLATVIEAQAALLRQNELTAALSQQRTYLAGFPQSEAASILLQAQDDWNSESYEECCRELARLEALRETHQTRHALLTRMEKAASAWAHAIRNRDGIHGTPQPPGDPDAAWRWRQWHDELERRASVSIPELQDRLNATQDELRHTAAEIIERETWAAQRERMDLHSQQALMGYVQTLRRIGRGTGKRVPALLRDARQLLASARRAVPVWIMPLSRVYESFDPRKTRFDVVIIDEASQSDVAALAALYFGREHVIVGDKEQVTPDAVGQQLDQVQRLIATNLQGIPNSHLYDGQTSIYDLAEAAFGRVIALREHFRCVPEIIQFSNHLSYGGTILPLREPNSASVRPGLIAHRVPGFRENGRQTNQIEAEEIASLIVACLEDPAYSSNEYGQPTSFGVISLLGVEQSLLIEDILRKKLSPSTFLKHRLLCGNAAQFQGDERDVIFLSMVDGPPNDGQLALRDEGPRSLYKKRYNVAVSRARNQLWVVHSLDPTAHLRPRDLRRRLIEHARNPRALLNALETQSGQTESIFESRVLERLIAAGYRVQTQWPVGAYRIDLVVEGKTKRLAVECDGEKWHTAEQLQHDIDREGILRRLGWNFVHIRGSIFFRDPDRAMVPVFANLDQLGIEPIGETAGTPKLGDLVSQIRRRAEVLRAQWQEERKDARQG